MTITRSSHLLWESIQTAFHSATGQRIKIPQILKRLIANRLWPSFLLLWVLNTPNILPQFSEHHQATTELCVIGSFFTFFESIQVQLFWRMAQPLKDCSKVSPLRHCYTEKLAHPQLSSKFPKASMCFRFQLGPSAVWQQGDTLPASGSAEKGSLVLWHLCRGESLTTSQLKYFSIFCCFQKGLIWG